MPSRSSGGKLTSLAPEFVDDDHYTYFKRLEEVVRWPKNLNIALSGSYGTGKSSVLEGFEREHGRKALRLAISSFGPSRGEESLTNRIQRELVKQLVYSASPGTRRRSRFRTPENLRWWRAPLEALGVVALIGTFGFLMGWLPVFSGAVALSHPVLSTILWVLVASVLVYVGAVVRIATHGRFMVSHLSAAGATFGLSERTHTYFDQYLDEIVNYFDNEPVTFVIFEDIDRFNDPDIFQALRDLNTLLNLRRSRADAAGPHAPDEPLRFIYAVRDSVFELLGSNRKQKKNDDAATAETVRANRTKFFDVVVPMVPFISHRNARDHLVGLLETAKIFEVKRDLVDMVALRCTDMRLLRNMCNEYLVFSERLLLPAKSAPGLSPSGLFALVAYKSFHLKDFEDISRGASQLDRLYNLRREFVRDCIKGLEDEVRNLKSGEERVRTGEELARKLGGRLNSFAEVIKKGSTKFSDGSPVSYKIGAWFCRMMRAPNAFGIAQVR